MAVEWSTAVVPPRKLTHYLLDSGHPEGWSKAVFFLGCGFDPARPEAFASALKRQAADAPDRSSIDSTRGVKYILDGLIECPDGVVRRIRTVWIVETGMAHARFVTAYPQEAE